LTPRSRFCVVSARAASTRSSAGMMNDAVLPLPVEDETIRSRPCKAGGMARAWTSVAFS
jgi:hypothetical protein